MWLKRLLKISATGPAGGGGGSGHMSDNVAGIGSGQGALFQAEPPNRREQQKEYNAKRRHRHKRMLERKRKWRLSRDRR